MDGADGLAIAALAASIGAGLMFVAAGLVKLRHRSLVEGVVADYRLLPASLVAPVARALPWGEIALGLALVAGLRPWAPGAGIALLLAFAAAMAVNIRRGRRNIDCGCGLSALRQPLGWGTVARNVALAASLLPATVLDAPHGAAAILVAAVTGAALFLCYLIGNAIAALPSTPSRAMGR
ncbi:MauE/DoxX family redox-associated membrane protein [Sphingomonas adhaesiva]|uniref:MauE/DoxX family redox-associated membrane protein n=1 Tax=Sphingomonas adhaesiva TaxID=28212 RepID=UPI002FF62DDF